MNDKENNAPKNTTSRCNKKLVDRLKYLLILCHKICERGE